ncbi:MAG: ROK family protein [Spirochaetota bacterium]|nr:ROK family protein [Spirochaetota bacterium]
MSQDVAIGIDIGGTFIKSALVSRKGEILSRKNVATFSGDKSFLFNIISIISFLSKQLTAKQSLIGIGIGAPGNINRKKGTIEGGAYNLKNVENISLVNEIRKDFPYPVYVDNDATNACKGEYLFGAGNGYEHLVTLTLGTGIGGGIILDCKVFHGISDYAGEIGHMTIIPNGMLCSCGNYGCLEAYASTTAMITLAKQSIKRKINSRLLEIPLEEINGEVICRFANEGDAVCCNILKKIAYYIAIAVSNIINMLNIPLVLIGGGISEAGDILFIPINVIAKDLVLPRLRDTFEVKKALLGNDAGVIGSASTVFMEGKSNF